jgi:uncharacterized membrane-anchored protein
MVLVFAVAGSAEAAKDKPSADKARAADADKAADKAKAAKSGKPAGDAKTDTAAPAEAPDGDAGAEGDPVAGLLARVPHLVGPKQVSLGHHVQIDLPAGMNLIEQAQAQELLRKAGENPEGLIAVILPPARSGMTWTVMVSVSEVGYVSDSDADELEAGDMLEQYKQGTVKQNTQRVAAGSPELFVDDWSEVPRYERDKHHLVWGLNVHDATGKSVNFFTRFLGRNGYLSVNLIDDPSKIQASKVEALSVLTALRFEQGSRYEDHASSDHDSGLGLKALVLGGAGVVIAKKTGILIAILLVLKKGIIVVFAAVAGFFRWLFRRKKAPETIDTAPSVTRDPDPPDMT